MITAPSLHIKMQIMAASPFPRSALRLFTNLRRSARAGLMELRLNLRPPTQNRVERESVQSSQQGAASRLPARQELEGRVVPLDRAGRSSVAEVRVGPSVRASNVSQKHVHLAPVISVTGPVSGADTSHARDDSDTLT
jgi:hypothetical protein